ncbi:LysR family transcriptional regulator [Actibacterium sp.]|uniref:LysR family transcriptional regulator n=1 Tax=Actibacterium sp. TaxID=1872125 RepID=UPI0035654CC5
MKNWDDLRYLLALHKAGTMTAAAQILGTNVATVSRRIEKMSETFGYPPFTRQNDRWMLTSRLQNLVETIEVFESALTREKNRAMMLSDDQRLPIRVGTPPMVASQVLYPSFQYAMEALSHVGLEFFERVGGEGMGEHDIVIQPHRPVSGRLITQRVGSMRLALYAPRGYSGCTQWIGLSRSFDDLPSQQIGFRHFDTDPIIRTHLAEHVYQIMKTTGLPGIVPCTMVAHDPDMELLDPKTGAHDLDFWVAYHASRQGDPIIQATKDWISHCFKKLAEAEKTLPGF